MVSAPASASPIERPRRPYANSDALQSHDKTGTVSACVRRAQDWLNVRFEHVCPEDFCEGNVLFYTAQLLDAPVGFENVWGGAIGNRFRCAGGPALQLNEGMCRVYAVLLLADVGDKEQMRSITDMGNFINETFGEEAPLLVLVPHSVCPDIRDPVDFEDSFAALVNAVDNGIDETITGEPEGMALAVEVHNRVLVQNSLVQKFKGDSDSETNEDQETRAKHAKFLEEVMHDTIWDYLRVRLDVEVPAIDWGITPGIPDKIEDYKLSTYLGKGSFGQVYRLDYDDGDQEPTGSVVKAMPKKHMLDMASLYNVRKQIEVMRLLSEDFPHPNVTKLHNVYHSQTHLLFELEDCGPMDLYKCYRERESRQTPFCPSKTQMIAQQMIGAVCHMHVKANVVHCDLKPENIIISETRNSALIKICDFDTAKVNPSIPQHGIVGTFPFSAPEIIIDRKFDPYAVDIWSMGLVLLELLCFSKVLETVLQLNNGDNARTKRQRSEARRLMMIRIQDFFSHEEAIYCLLQENMRRELHGLLNRSFLWLLKCMLNVASAERIQASELIECL